MDVLPVEIWCQIVEQVLLDQSASGLLYILTICKTFKDIALPYLYSRADFHLVDALVNFTARLVLPLDSQHELLNRPSGCWVQTIDLSRIPFSSQRSDAIYFDSILTELFPLVPKLAHLRLNPSIVMGPHAVLALASRPESVHLKTLAGIRCINPVGSPMDDPNDAFVLLLRHSPNLEDVEFIGSGIEPNTTNQRDESVYVSPASNLILPRLHTISILSMTASPLISALIGSDLPALRKLRVTPYDDIPYPINLTSKLIQVHGPRLQSLHLETIKSWPTIMHKSPVNLLMTCPQVHHLSLENPIPSLLVGESHPVQIISLPRPSMGSEWRIIETAVGHLPALTAIRAREVRWLRAGVTGRALEAGVQGEMREWRRKLARRGIKMLDADWKEEDVTSPNLPVGRKAISS